MIFFLVIIVMDLEGLIKSIILFYVDFDFIEKKKYFKVRKL